MEKSILIIEDNKDEAAYALDVVKNAGFSEVHVIDTLSRAVKAIPCYDGVLTDLFFPLGDSIDEEYIQRFLPHYEEFRKKTFTKLEGLNPVKKALETVALTFGTSPREYVENVMSKLNTPRNVLKAAQDTIAGINDTERYEKFLKIEEGIREGTNLPLGIVASEIAHKVSRPCVIVTSTYHHDDAFEPISSLINVPYKDTLVDGRKNWSGGIESLF